MRLKDVQGPNATIKELKRRGKNFLRDNSSKWQEPQPEPTETSDTLKIPDKSSEMKKFLSELRLSDIKKLLSEMKPSDIKKLLVGLKQYAPKRLPHEYTWSKKEQIAWNKLTSEKKDKCNALDSERVQELQKEPSSEEKELMLKRYHLSLEKKQLESEIKYLEKWNCASMYIQDIIEGLGKKELKGPSQIRNALSKMAGGDPSCRELSKLLEEATDSFASKCKARYKLKRHLDSILSEDNNTVSEKVSIINNKLLQEDFTDLDNYTEKKAEKKRKRLERMENEIVELNDVSYIKMDFPEKTDIREYHSEIKKLLLDIEKMNKKDEKHFNDHTAIGNLAIEYKQITDRIRKAVKEAQDILPNESDLGSQLNDLETYSLPYHKKLGEYYQKVNLSQATFEKAMENAKEYIKDSRVTNGLTEEYNSLIKTFEESVEDVKNKFSKKKHLAYRGMDWYSKTLEEYVKRCTKLVECHQKFNQNKSIFEEKMNKIREFKDPLVIDELQNSYNMTIKQFEAKAQDTESILNDNYESDIEVFTEALEEQIKLTEQLLDPFQVERFKHQLFPKAKMESLEDPQYNNKNHPQALKKYLQVFEEWKCFHQKYEHTSRSHQETEKKYCQNLSKWESKQNIDDQTLQIRKKHFKTALQNFKKEYQIEASWSAFDKIRTVYEKANSLLDIKRKILEHGIEEYQIESDFINYQRERINIAKELYEISCIAISAMDEMHNTNLQNRLEKNIQEEESGIKEAEKIRDNFKKKLDENLESNQKSIEKHSTIQNTRDKCQQDIDRGKQEVVAALERWTQVNARRNNMEIQQLALETLRDFFNDMKKVVDSLKNDTEE